jgi:glycosyltransferase involved in cell wall biosynthesis
LPGDIKKKYGGLANLKIIEKIIPWEQLEEEWATADIFVMPTRITPYQVILDAMSYELPIVTLDVFANGELVQDGRTGFLVEDSRKAAYQKFVFRPTPYTRMTEALEKVNVAVVRRLIDKIALLVDNPSLRRQMGKSGRWEVEHGKFSLRRRNEALKAAFDEALFGCGS